MVKGKSTKYIIVLVTVITVAVLNAVFVNITNSLSYIINYFINPIFLYLPMIVVDIASVLCVIVVLIEKRRFLKIITIVSLCLLFMYWVICFVILAYSQNKSYNEICNLRKFPQQIVNSILSEYSGGIRLDYEQNMLYAFGDSLLFESSNTYDVQLNEILGSCFMDVYCFDNYPILCNESSISKLKNTYFSSEYAYSLSNSVFGNDDIVYGIKNGVTYQYCCIMATNDEKLKNSIYFSVLIEDSNSVFLLSVRIYQKEYMYVNAEKALENIFNLTEQLWV